MRKTYLLLAALLAVAGICVMLWPAFTGHRLQADTDAAVQSFLEERKPEQQYPELLAALQEYNQQLYAEKQCNLTDLEACEEPAADLTTYGVADEIIGVLEIPAMELTMPVYLGASDAHLAAGAAVLGNTSAPIGGDRLLRFLQQVIVHGVHPFLKTSLIHSLILSCSSSVRSRSRVRNKDVLTFASLTQHSSAISRMLSPYQ